MQNSSRNLNYQSSPVSPSSLEQSFDSKTEKRNLLAKLDEMTKAIDTYKEQKNKSSYSSLPLISKNNTN